ncbi:biotin--[acetyl-CoA-carboxylase] ligase [Bifidobacterium sp.]|jgi:BirA family biotin operon repressor/biotin-[acetyl-CoA-carboxylase] ligase|uniref:biotin--[acetyl-CoA-carboxylase] ligase n=1 Tax=Bifidobacterium sp. TaxID=41200 RepID=UPI0025C52F5B|nr:biotin--acetyl-CoA-carboxylase ligase [Bifidobacterium sp.]MCH4209771.1 biotin--acetyl-CoA-carboxylase ligase [Bifidobacterium sp.]MCI1224562.1 biotin--acetyl-CoA-carboxylase ligase [Bifidobacterium sp.]
MMTVSQAATPRMPRTAREADRLVVRASVDSTNYVARHMIEEDQLMPRQDGRLPITVVAADMQTSGHGRLGREWVNVPGESFTVSFATVLPRALATDGSVNGWIQMAAGLASLDSIRGALEEVGSKSIRPGRSLALKWPNDVFCRGLKLGGILCELVPLPHVDDVRVDVGDADGGTQEADGDGAEAAPASDVEFDDCIGVVFGVGLNLAVRAERLPTPESTSLQLHREGLPEARIMRDLIAAGIVRSLRKRLQSLIDDTPGQRDALLEETRAECWTLGRRVKARLATGGAICGTAVALNPDASLSVRDDAGEICVVRTGDVGVLG